MTENSTSRKEIRELRHRIRDLAKELQDMISKYQEKVNDDMPEYGGPLEELEGMFLERCRCRFDVPDDEEEDEAWERLETCGEVDDQYLPRQFYAGRMLEEAEHRILDRMQGITNAYAQGAVQVAHEEQTCRIYAWRHTDLPEDSSMQLSCVQGRDGLYIRWKDESGRTKAKKGDLAVIVKRDLKKTGFMDKDINITYLDSLARTDRRAQLVIRTAKNKLRGYDAGKSRRDVFLEDSMRSLMRQMNRRMEKHHEDRLVILGELRSIGITENMAVNYGLMPAPVHPAGVTSFARYVHLSDTCQQQPEPAQPAPARYYAAPEDCPGPALPF